MILAHTAAHRSHCRVQPVARRISAYAQADRLQTPSVNCFELLSGAAAGKRRDNIRRLRAADVRRELERPGVSIGMGDSLIAGIALAHSLPLFTRNPTARSRYRPFYARPLAA